MFKKNLVLMCLFVMSIGVRSYAMDMQAQVEREQMFIYNQEVTSLLAQYKPLEREKSTVIRSDLENKKTEIQDYIAECEDQPAKQYGQQLIHLLDQALQRTSKSKKMLSQIIVNTPYVSMFTAAGAEQ